MIPTRDELIERAVRMPTSHECHPLPSDVADFARTEIRRALEVELEALRDHVVGHSSGGYVPAHAIDARLAALREQTEQPPGAATVAEPRTDRAKTCDGAAGSTPAPGATERDGRPVAQLEEQPHSKRQREGLSPSGPANPPQVNSAVSIARLLSTEGFTDYIGQQVKRYALRNATDEQRRSFLKTQRRFKEIMQKLGKDEKKIVGAFIRNLEGMGFDTGLRIGLTAYQRECQAEQRVGGSMEGHARPKGTDAGSSPAPHTNLELLERVRVLEQGLDYYAQNPIWDEGSLARSYMGKPGAESQTQHLQASERAEGRAASSPCPPPALSDSDVLAKAVEIVKREERLGIGGRYALIATWQELEKLAAKLRAASAPKPVDVFEAFDREWHAWDRGGEPLPLCGLARDWFGGLVEALEHIEKISDPQIMRETARYALSALRRKAEEASRG